MNAAPSFLDGSMPNTTPETSRWQLHPELAKAALERAPAIIYVYDVRGERSIFQNRRFAELLDQPLDQETAADNDWRRYIHPDDALGFPAHRARLKAIQPGDVLTWTFRMQSADGSWHHFISRDTLLEADANGEAKLVVGTASNIDEQKAMEERKNLLLGEMRHRARNLMAMIDAIGRQSMPKGVPVVKQFFDTFMGRMRALLEAGDVVARRGGGRQADLRAVAEAALAPFLGPSGRVKVDGPDVFVPEYAAGGLGLALYELATNAVKYGALSAHGGSVALSWDLTTGEERLVTIEWREVGGPVVAPPSREGFGSRVIRNALSGRGSEVDLAFHPDGVLCRIRFVVDAAHG